MLSSLSQEVPLTPPPDTVRDVNLENFMTDVIEASKKQLVVVNFWSPRAPAATKQFMATLEKLILSYRGSVTLARIDVDQNPQIAQQMGVQSVPSVFAFFQGRPLDGFTGALPEAQIKTWLDKVTKGSGAPAPVSDGIDEALKHASDALTAQDAATAHAIYADILDVDPNHVVATAGLLRAMMALGETDSARAIFAQLPAPVLKDKAFDAVRAAFELADQAPVGADLSQMLSTVEKDPSNHQARFDLAMAYYAAGQKEAAVDQLLEIVRRQRSWNEDAARKQLVKLFEAFGGTDPLTISSRKKLSALLFA